MQLIDLLAPRRVSAGACFTSKKRLLEQVAQMLADDESEAVQRDIYDSLVARERLGSTGLGAGVAIPHGRVKSLSSARGAFLRLIEPIDFNSVDGQKVDLVLALVVPESFTDQHLLLLSQVAEMFSESELTSRLRGTSDSAELFDLLSDWQLKHPQA
jgi:PTS system nitrogen regulatory IIA component